ncbi:MAG: hypothetical protein SPK73_06705, partial [Eubacteriales bacterium]|nr:hypothetical protein [Eubacteriales bacterium]
FFSLQPNKPAAIAAAIMSAISLFIKPPYHQLTRGNKVLRSIHHAIAASNSFEIPPVFLHSFSLLCHTVCSLKLSDPKEPDLRAVQGRGEQNYWR